MSEETTRLLSIILTQLSVNDRKQVVSEQDKYRIIFEMTMPKLIDAIHSTADNLSSDELTDIVADTWETIWSKLNTYNEEKAQFVTWISAIARNKTIDYLRKHQRQKRKEETLETNNKSINQSHSGISEETDPLIDQLIVKDLQNAAMSVLLSLPALDRDLYLLRMSFDVTYSDLAEIVSQVREEPVTAKAIEHRISRIRQKLLEALRQKGLMD